MPNLKSQGNYVWNGKVTNLAYENHLRRDKARFPLNPDQHSHMNCAGVGVMKYLQKMCDLIKNKSRISERVRWPA